MKNITARTSSFRKIIETNSLYIDKTKEIYALLAAAQAKDAYYFLARPRRFGKTLLISTLKELFAGKRELFKGLWIDSSDYNWEEHPVITFDFSTIENITSKEFKEDLALEIEEKATELGVTLPTKGSVVRKIKTLVKELAKTNTVVILIDEYDYPIINNINSEKVMQTNLKILRSFFAALKGLDDYLHAIFITGVSQIPKASLFSGLNNLENISLDPIASTILGYTKEEIVLYFSDYIQALANIKSQPLNKIEESIKVWYNGYQFSKKDVKVYNPFSLHYLFNKNEFDNCRVESSYRFLRMRPPHRTQRAKLPH